MGNGLAGPTVLISPGYWTVTVTGVVTVKALDPLPVTLVTVKVYCPAGVPGSVFPPPPPPPLPPSPLLLPLPPPQALRATTNPIAIAGKNLLRETRLVRVRIITIPTSPIPVALGKTRAWGLASEWGAVVMTVNVAVKRLIASFDALPEADKHFAAVEILRRTEGRVGRDHQHR